MTTYELMIKTNHFLIQDGHLTESQKESIATQLLQARSQPSMDLSKVDRGMYPLYYLPPENNCKKYKTIFNQIPKTQIFAANMYELEILRLLHMLRPQLPEVQQMISGTLERLKTTCFGYMDDGVGECFDASLVVLRFLATVAPKENKWIESRIQNFIRHYDEKKRPWYCLWYYWLCLSELPFETVRPEVDKYRRLMLSWLRDKGFVMHSEHDTTIHPVLAYMLRDNLARYPEFAHIKDRKPYISEKDGRLRFPMELAMA